MSDNMRCAECGWIAPAGQVHTWLFCQMHKAGFDRYTIIANVLFTADALRGREDR